MRALIMSAAIAAITCEPTQAETLATGSFLSGNELHELCRNANSTATSYIIGVADSFLFVQRSTNSRNFCIPANVNSEQITDVICESLKANPATRNNTAPSIALSAIKKAWPCR